MATALPSPSIGPVPGQKREIAASNDIDVVIERFAELIAADLLPRRAAVLRLVGDRLDLKQHARHRRMTDSNPRARGPSVAEKRAAHRLDLRPIVDLVHQDLEVGNVVKRHSRRAEHEIDVVTCRLALLDDVAGSDDVGGHVEGGRPGQVEKIAAQHGVGVMAQGLHHLAVKTDFLTRPGGHGRFLLSIGDRRSTASRCRRERDYAAASMLRIEVPSSLTRACV